MSAAVTPLYVTISGEREQSEEVSYAPPERKFDLKFSILEIAPPTAIGLDERESHWKALLDSRNSGYNRN